MMNAQHIAEVAQEAGVDQIGPRMPFDPEERLPELIDHALDELKLRPREFTQGRGEFVDAGDDILFCHRCALYRTGGVYSSFPASAGAGVESVSALSVIS